jgi:hypothetical protein
MHLGERNLNPMVIKRIFRDEQGRVSYLLISIGILVISIITLLFVILKLRSPAGNGFINLPSPIEVIWSMYESSLRGDIDSYLNCFAPESQLSIQETLKSMGKEAFREYLRNKAIGIMGVSIYSSDRTNIDTIGKNNLNNQAVVEITQQFGEDVMSLPVEIVFKGRNEVQVFNLKRAGKAWKILRVSLPTLTPQPIPYGQNVNE